MVTTKRGLDASDVFRLFSFLEQAHVVTPTIATVRRSVELCCMYQLSFWDACIFAAAEAGNCRTILAEDFQIGRAYSGIRVVDPFA